MRTELLFPPEQIQERVRELAAQINRHYSAETEVVCACVANGAFIFYADLVRKLNCRVIFDVVVLSSYRGRQSTGKVKVVKKLSKVIKNRHVLIIEDIIDSGLTMNTLQTIIKVEEPKSLLTVSLLKRRHQRYACDIDYYGFEVQVDDFVVGYGLDGGTHYNPMLDYISLVKKESPADS